MELLTITCSQLSQIIYYFKGLENDSTMVFSQKRKLLKFNEILEKEFLLFTKEVTLLANEYCEKNDSDEFILNENGEPKIKQEYLETCQKALDDLYSAELEIEYQPFKLDEKYFDNLQCDVSTVKLIENNFLEE